MVASPLFQSAIVNRAWVPENTRLRNTIAEYSKAVYLPWQPIFAAATVLIFALTAIFAAAAIWFCCRRRSRYGMRRDTREAGGLSWFNRGSCDKTANGGGG